MRRIMLLLLLLSLSIPTAPAVSAEAGGSDPNATAPSSVSRGATFVFTIRNCSPRPGEAEEAWVWFSSTNSPAEPTPIEQEMEADGTTDIPHSYATTGVKGVLVRCMLESSFHDTTHWQETLSISVVEGTVGGQQTGPSLTAAERKKCKKIDNAVRRRTCLKRQAAD